MQTDSPETAAPPRRLLAAALALGTVAATLVPMLVAASAGAQPAGVAEPHSARLTVTATGIASAAPDQATLRLGVEATGRDAAAAMAANTDRMQAIFDTLAAADIPEADIATQDLRLQPRYADARRSSGGPQEEPRIRGYTSRNTVSVVVRDLDRVGAILDRLVDAGANRIRSVGFSVADTRDLESAARRDAATRALAKARDYAGALGVEIRGLVEIATGRQRPPQPMRMQAAETARAGGRVPVSGGDVEVSTDITAVFATSRALR